jgi:hypothetical protein
MGPTGTVTAAVYTTVYAVSNEGCYTPAEAEGADITRVFIGAPSVSVGLRRALQTRRSPAQAKGAWAAGSPGADENHSCVIRGATKYLTRRPASFGGHAKATWRRGTRSCGRAGSTPESSTNPLNREWPRVAVGSRSVTCVNGSHPWVKARRFLSLGQDGDADPSTFANAVHARPQSTRRVRIERARKSSAAVAPRNQTGILRPLRRESTTSRKEVPVGMTCSPAASAKER